MTAEELDRLTARLKAWAQVGDDALRLIEWQKEAKAALVPREVLGTPLATHISRELTLIDEVRRLRERVANLEQEGESFREVPGLTPQQRLEWAREYPEDVLDDKDKAWRKLENVSRDRETLKARVAELEQELRSR